MLGRVARQSCVRRPRTRSFTASSVARWQHLLPSLSGLPVDIAPEVAQAQAEGRPVVALESTLITHGLPPPHSQTLAKECEALLRSQSVAPATVAILDGRVKVGLEERDLDLLAERGWEARRDAQVAKRLWKVGRRELGAALVKGVHGGTTVSGTMAVAHLAGIKVFSTGGIGGVHRGAETSFDISSDLISLSDTPVAVVCAGSKSILDIGLTLEYLEAHAVPVSGYKTSDWPAFYTAQSGFKAPMQLDSAAEVAQTILTTDRLGLSSSLLLGNPIPAEYHAVGAELQTAVDQAVAESVENGMAKSGKQVTPWLLQRVAELSKGKSLESNKALIRNNVKVGGEVAVEYARLLKESSAAPSSTSMPSFPPSPPPSPAPASADSSAPTERGFLAHSVRPAALVVVGVLAVDISMVPNSTSPLQTTAPGSVSLTLGGVAGNVAGAAHALLSPPSSDPDKGEVLLVAPVASDLLGEVAKSGLRARGMRSDGLLGSDGATATCGYLLDEKGELVGGVADMGIAKELGGKKIVERIAELKPRLVCFDGNIEMNAMVEILLHCVKNGISTFFEPTSNAKSLQLLNALESSPLSSLLPLAAAPVSYSAPNIHELSALYDRVAFSEHSVYAPGPWFDGISVRADELALRLPRWVVDEGIAQMAVRLLPVIGTLFVKNGAQGVLVVQRVSGVDAVSRWRSLPPKKGTLVVPSVSTPAEAVVLRHYPALELDASEIVSVTGAGDNLAGATLAAMVRGLSPLVPQELDQIVEVAQKAAVATLKSAEAVGNHATLQRALISL